MSRKRNIAVPVLVVLAALLFGAILYVEQPELIPMPVIPSVMAEGGSGAYFLPNDPDAKLLAYANQNDLSVDIWSEELKELLRKIPEAETFVLNYPFLKDTPQPIDLSQYENCTQIPHLLQWDAQWGYTQYGDDIMGLTGCGPTCLSMVSIYLLQDIKYSPRYIADFSEENGYYTEGFGSAWALISRGGEKLGLDVTELPPVWSVVSENLNAGNPVICIFGPGDFTETGHFVVMAEEVDGMVKVLDPNSMERTQKLWNFDEIQDQIQNLWACRLP